TDETKAGTRAHERKHVRGQRRKNMNIRMSPWIRRLCQAALVGMMTACGASPGSEEENTNKPETSMQKDLRELMEAQVQEQGILGLGMALRAMDGTVIGVGVGVTDPDEKNDWSPETRSALGSITKTFTAVVIMQL